MLRNAIYAIVLDLDDFKEINATYGHSVGDIILRESARAIKDEPEAVAAARVAGDRFVVLCRAENEQRAYDAAERLRRAVSRGRVWLANTVIEITTCTAIVLVDDVTTSVDAILKRAGSALRKTKSRGGNRSRAASVQGLSSQIRRRS